MINQSRCGSAAEACASVAQTILAFVRYHSDDSCVHLKTKMKQNADCVTVITYDNSREFKSTVHYYKTTP